MSLLCGPLNEAKLSCFYSGQTPEVGDGQLSILHHGATFLQLVVAAVARRQMRIKICNLKKMQAVDKDRGRL